MDTLPGQSFPIGATVRPDGVNFCVFSKNCTALELLLFDQVDDSRPARTLPIPDAEGELPPGHPPTDEAAHARAIARHLV